MPGGAAQYRAAAAWTETTPHRCTIVGGLDIEAQFSGNGHGRARYAKQGGMPGAGGALTLPALAMKREDRFRLNAVAHRATGTTSV